MGVQWCLSLVFWVLVSVFLVNSVQTLVERNTTSSMPDACRIPGCKCTDAAKIWKIINCTFNSTQKVEFAPNSIPTTTMEVSITGGEELILHGQTFNSLRGLNLVRIDGTRRLLMRKGAFLELTSTSLLLQVQSCDRLIIEINAFRNMQTPISIEISRCSYVSIQNSAFSRLQEGRFHNIPYLELAENSFLFKNQGVTDRHGPVATILFDNVIVPKITRATFPSSLAEISIKNSEIREIHSEAFTASQISSVLIVNSSINKIQSGAFTDRTLLCDFKLSKCRIRLLETKAVVASMTNLIIEHSIITEIQNGAINSTIAKVIISDNEIGIFRSKGFVLNEWNHIQIDNNIFKHIHGYFLDVRYNPKIQQIEFSFVGNEVYRIDNGALDFVPGLEVTTQNLRFDNNFFNQTCHCDIDKWIEELLSGAAEDVSIVLNSSFCTINEILSRCFQLQEGLINMHNFTELVCGSEDSIKCEPYSGETKILDAKTTLLEEDNRSSNSSLILGLLLGAVLIIAASGTIVILLIRAGLWLKRKGYCMRFRNNMHYHHERTHQDEDGTIVAIDTSDKADVPEELTPEILQRLREQLEDPMTHEDAREMIERLYELFITGDSYTNNNRQEEEAHLYEELGNLQLPKNTQQNDKRHCDNTEPFGFLRMMEEKYNGATNAALVDNQKPMLAGEYSEPTDAALHLYSELQSNKNDAISDLEKRDSFVSFQSNTQQSNNSGKMAFRPLPDKPNINSQSIAGPSKK